MFKYYRVQREKRTCNGIYRALQREFCNSFCNLHFAVNFTTINNERFRPTTFRGPPVFYCNQFVEYPRAEAESKYQTIRKVPAFKQWINVNCC